MQETQMVYCIMGAMIGAGFVSGRELMQFFSRYGHFSWPLVISAGVAILFIMNRIMNYGKKNINDAFPAGAAKILLIFLFAATGGSMTAAGSEIAALMLPIPSARWIGMGITLGLGLILSGRAIRALNYLGKFLLPFMILAFLMCLRIPGEEIAIRGELNWGAALWAFMECLGYAGMNVMLSAGLLCKMSEECGDRGRCRGTVWASGMIMGIMMLGNWVMMRHGELQNEALPIVILLKSYGKAGFYFSGIILYLAMITTLIAVLQGMRGILKGWIKHEKIISALIMALIALTGFESIVAFAYPASGLLCFVMLFFPKKRERLIQPPAHIRESDACRRNNPAPPV